MPEVTPDERRSPLKMQREHIIVASIGFEYWAAWCFTVWGLALMFSANGHSVNPVVDTISAYEAVTSPILAAIGLSHLYALLRWPHTTPKYILMRKVCTGVEFVFWLCMLIASALIVSRNPNGWLSPLSTLPIVVFLAIALLRRRYRDW